MNKPIIIEAKSLSKSFGKPVSVEVLKNFSLTVHLGESIAIMGPSGVGKSTLLHILGALEKPTGGSLSIFGKEIENFSPYKLRNEKIGFIFQSFHLLEDYTALENVLFPAWIKRERISKNAPAYKRALSLIDQVGLSERKHFSVKTLSGGERQRVAIARALCNDPLLLLADEPTGNLDQENSEMIHELLLSFVKKEGKTLIVVTHDVHLSKSCGKTILLEKS